MSRSVVVGLVALAACSPPPVPVEKPLPPQPPPTIFSISGRGVGPIDKDTPANLTALRALVGPHGYAVRPINDGGVELHVYDGTEHVLYVIPNDDGSLFNVHVVSGSVAVTGHPYWVIGKPFSRSDLLGDCQCWGTHPVCWPNGEHIALGFRRTADDSDENDCDGLGTPSERRSLEGHRIQRVVWSPQAFGTERHGNELPEWIPREDP